MNSNSKLLLVFMTILVVNLIDIRPVKAISTDNPVQYNTPFSGVPDPRDAVIYQVNIRCFSTTRNFQGVIARLDSIKNLGVNVLYLMPVYPVGVLKTVYSPYCVKDYLAINAAFGTLTDLRTLIDGAHSRGMAVMLDWVANHTAWDNTWISNKSWYSQDASGNIVSPSGWTDVAQLNFQNQDMRAAMISAMKYWVYTANCDGFRCDYADGPPADFWKQAIDTLRNIKTHNLLMFAEGTRSNHFSSGFDYIFGMRLYNQLKTIYSSNVAVTNINSINTSDYSGASASNMVVRYITNHDVNSSDGTPLDLFGGSTGSMAAFVVAAYMKGVPMIYNGQEVGNPTRLTFPFLTSSINWTLNPSMVAEYKKIIAFRAGSNAIRRGTLTSYCTTDICAFSKTSGSETVLVISNLRNSTINFTLPVTYTNSQATDAFSGETFQTGTQLTMAPYTYRVLKIGTLPSTGIKVSFQKPATWTAVNLYAWIGTVAPFTEPLGGWPGMSLTDSNGWYSYTFDASIGGVNLILNNNGVSQTTGVYVTSPTCFTSDGTTLTVANCNTGLKEPNIKTLIIYPNPVIDELNFSSSESIERFSIHSITGETVLTVSSISKDTGYSLKSLKSGIYFLSVKFTNGENQVEKFVKQ